MLTIDFFFLLISSPRCGLNLENDSTHVEFSLNSPTKYDGDLLRDIR